MITKFDGMEILNRPIIEIEEKVKEMYEDRKNRDTHPEGEFDGKQRWTPDKYSEEAICCYSIRTPSASWPFSLIKHCRSKKHLKHLASETLVKAAIIKIETMENIQDRLEIVKDLDNRICRIYDLQKEELVLTENHTNLIQNWHKAQLDELFFEQSDKRIQELDDQRSENSITNIKEFKQMIETAVNSDP